jgi:hypothetical protein
MTNLKAKINANGYLWLEGNFNYYDDTNPTTITIEKPPVINEVDISAYETWVEIIRVFNNQTSRDFGQAVNNIYVINENNPKGTILTIKVYFINPISEDEIATNEVNIQFGINKRSGILPPSVIPETKILDKAFTDFIIIGRNIDFYNVSGLKVSSGTFSDLATSGDLNSKPDKSDLENYTRNATIKIAAYDATSKSKAGADYICAGGNDDAIINPMLAELEGIGGCVELSEGTFHLSDGLTLPNNILLKGQGYATKIIGEDTFNAIIVSENVKAAISHLHIQDALNGIFINNGNALITACQFYNMATGSGVRINLGNGIANITQCDFISNKYGVWAYGKALILTNNYFFGNFVGDLIYHQDTEIKQDNNLAYSE